jgi:hypothetical protein
MIPKGAMAQRITAQATNNTHKTRDWAASMNES